MLTAKNREIKQLQKEINRLNSRVEFWHKKSKTMDKESKNFMVVTSDNWLEVWSIGYSSREKAQLRVDEGYFLKYAMRELKDRRLQVITHEEHENFKKMIKKYNKNEKICD